MNRFLIIACFLIAACGPRQIDPDTAAECANCERWNTPQKPFRIYGNTWYVGTRGLASILIESSAGLILLDGGLPQSAALIDANIRQLGFDPLQISAILLSHAHFDHAGGIAALQRLSGADVYTSPAGVAALTSGVLQADDPQFGMPDAGFPAVRNVTAIGNGDVLTVGDLNVTAIHTPGHAPSGMTWTWEGCALERCYDIVYAESLTAVAAEGYHFSAGPAANQLTESAGAISDLDCDILLTPHPVFFSMQAKLQKRDAGNPFVNNVACMIYADTMLGWLEQRLHSEGARKTPVIY